MRAVILATGYSEPMEALIYKRPMGLLRIADKPIIVHVVEALARQGIHHLHVVLSYYPEMIEQVLEEGPRWGVHITYHLTNDWRRPFRSLTPAVKGWEDQWVVIASGDMVPKPHLRELSEPLQPLLWFTPAHQWTGWGIVPSRTIAHLDRHILTEQFPDFVKNASRPVIKEPFLSAVTPSDLQRSNLHCLRLADPQSLFPSAARKVQPGVWISRGVVIHPSAVIVPPVFLSEYVQVRDGARIGPDAIVEARCVIDKGSSVKKSIICRDSYIGESLDVRNSIIDHDTLINLSLKSHVHITDEFILSQLKTPIHRLHFSSLAMRLLFLGGLLIAAPLLLVLAGLYGITGKQVLQLPASIHCRDWRTFSLLRLQHPPRWLPRWLVSLPVLVNLVRGQVQLIGVRPLTVSEVKALAPDWRHLYLRSKVGLITLEQVAHGPQATVEERFAADTFYVAKGTLRLDMKIFWRWLKRT